MKISSDWLSELVTWQWSAEELADRLTCLGLNVEGIEEYAVAFPGVVVARVLAADPHPNADRLTVCEVHDGQEKAVVVCGAPNVRSGLNVLLAKPGAILPGNFRIKKTRIRGTDSAGMICSGRELEINDDKEGILELPTEAIPGTPADELFGFRDTVLDIEVTPNRPDWLSHLGVAREIAALVNTKVRFPSLWSDKQGSGESLDFIVEIEDFRDCPRYSGFGARGVRVGPSPSFIQNRLRAIGSRPINNAVDITNYVLFELGQPLHAFDRSFLRGDRILVRRARPGEKLTTLDGQAHALSPEHLVIADSERPVALAGIMGGQGSQVVSGTEDILLESAFFDPGIVRKTGRQLALNTDSSYRFEREADWNMVEKAAKRALWLFAEYAGARILTDWIDRQDPDRKAPGDLPLRVYQVNRLLGTEFDTAEAANLLQRLDLKVVPLGSSSVPQQGAADMMVSVPSFRRDLKLEVDLIEEIARLHGYDSVPRQGRFRGGGSEPPRSEDLRQQRCRHYLATAGYFEIATSSFMEAKDLDRLQIPEGDPRRLCLQVANPHHGGGTFMRTSLLPSFLRAFQHNINVGNPLPVKLFHYGKVFLPAVAKTETGSHPDEGLLPHEPLMLQFGLAGRTDKGLGGVPADLLEIKGILEVLSQLLRWPLQPVPAGGETTLAPDRQWQLQGPDGRFFGSAGAVREPILAAYDIDFPVSVVEIDLAQIRPANDQVTFCPFSRFPAVKRDLSLLVPTGLQFARLAEVVEKSGGELLENLELFDFYKGKSIDSGQVALGIRLKFRSGKGNLKGRVVDKAIGEIEKALAEQLDVHIRS